MSLKSLSVTRRNIVCCYYRNKLPTPQKSQGQKRAQTQAKWPSSAQRTTKQTQQRTTEKAKNKKRAQPRDRRLGMEIGRRRRHPFSHPLTLHQDGGPTPLRRSGVGPGSSAYAHAIPVHLGPNTHGHPKGLPIALHAAPKMAKIHAPPRPTSGSAEGSSRSPLSDKGFNSFLINRALRQRVNQKKQVCFLQPLSRKCPATRNRTRDHLIAA